jgi:hypothetical protein
MILRKKLMLLALAVSLAACSAPIRNVDHAAFATTSGKNLSLEQARAAIIRAGAALGWEIKDDGPSSLTGTLHLRKHTAVVEIPYSATDYSIEYRSSVNLNEKNGRIHKNYNGWVQNLSKRINVELQLANN